MKTERIHFGYIISFLIIVIIALVTIKWGAIKELTNYITFALTLTSLVLAILAIVYSFFSNSSMTKNISNLEEASNKIFENSELLNTATKGLEEQLGDIPDSLKNIEFKTDSTLRAFEEFSKKDLVSRKLAEPSKEKYDDSSIGKLLVYKGSISTTGLLLALKLIFEKNVQFNFDELTTGAEISSKDYSYGFIIACSTLNLIKYDSIEVGKLKWDWKITYLSEDITNNIEDAVNIIIKDNKGKEHMDFIENGFDKIREYVDNL